MLANLFIFVGGAIFGLAGGALLLDYMIYPWGFRPK